MTIIRCDCCRAEMTRRAGNHLRCCACSRKYDRGMKRAHNAVRAAVKRGDLPDLRYTEVACVDCGDRADRYDHRDYLKRLDVEPVCHRCNRLRGPGANIVEAAA